VPPIPSQSSRGASRHDPGCCSAFRNGDHNSRGDWGGRANHRGVQAGVKPAHGTVGFPQGWPHRIIGWAETAGDQVCTICHLPTHRQMLVCLGFPGCPLAGRDRRRSEPEFAGSTRKKCAVKLAVSKLSSAVFGKSRSKTSRKCCLRPWKYSSGSS